MKGFLAALVLSAQAAVAQTGDAGPMTLSRLAELVFLLDAEAENRGPTFRMRIADVPVLIVTDPEADRMRAMTPVAAVDGLGPGDLARMMQANFDTALDARYAIADGQVWAVFIHPLSPLDRRQLVSGLGQVVNLARTYGTFYTGGALGYGGGDSGGLHRELIDELMERSAPI